MKKVTVSFLTTRYDLMKKHWEKHSALKKNGIVGTNKPIGRNVDLGGVLITIDWDKQRIVYEKRISCPSGVVMWDGFLTVASMRKNEIYLLDKKNVASKIITSPYLNDVHSIATTREGTLLVTSTGIDAILEFDTNSNVIWHWFAFQHGFDKDQYGNKRKLQMNGVDHRKIDYPTLHQTTHINSVIQHPQKKDVLIATLFHQGSVVSIDKKTSNVSTLLQGLKSVHSIKKINDGYIVSDTKSGTVILLDESFRETRRYNVNSTWLQDSSISPWGTLLAARGDKGDIVETSLDTGETLDIFSFNKNWRVYQLFCEVR